MLYHRGAEGYKGEDREAGGGYGKSDYTRKGVNMLTIEEIKFIVIPLVEPYLVSRVILIGSYARGEATEKSDVDLIIDSEGKLSGFDYFGIAGRIIKKMPVKTDVFELREINKPSALFDNINKEGIVIYGK